MWKPPFQYLPSRLDVDRHFPSRRNAADVTRERLGFQNVSRFHEGSVRDGHEHDHEIRRHRGGDGAADAPADRDDAARQAAFFVGNPAADEAGASGIRPCLEQAATEAEEEQRDEGGRQPHQAGEDGPDCEVEREHPPGPIAIAQPAAGDLPEGVGEKEGAEQKPGLSAGEPKVLADVVDDEAETEAIEI